MRQPNQRWKPILILVTCTTASLLSACGAGSGPIPQSPVHSSMRPSGSDWSCAQYSDSAAPTNRKTRCWRAADSCVEGVGELKAQTALHDFGTCESRPAAFCYIRTHPSGEDEAVCSLSQQECEARSEATAFRPVIPSGMLVQERYTRVSTCTEWD